MKKLITLILFTGLVSLPAADLVKVSVTITNTPIATETLIVNGSTRTWVSSVTTPATEVLIGADEIDSNDNLFEHIAATLFTSQMTLSELNPTNIVITFLPGATVTSSVTGSWATLAQTTNTTTTATTIRVPQTVEASTVRTNAMTLLVTGLEDYSQNLFSQSAGLLAEYVSLEGSQSVSNKAIYASTFDDPITTNLVNNGNAISSPGTGTTSEQFGSGADASGLFSLSVGFGSLAADTVSVAIGNGANATNYAAVALGYLAAAHGGSSMSIGNAALTQNTNSIAIGELSQSSYDNAIAIGNGVATTAADQIRLGSSTHDVVIPGTLTVTLGMTNSTLGGITMTDFSDGVWTDGGATNLVITNMTSHEALEVVGDIAYNKADHTTLATGNNAGIDFGEVVFAKIASGPGGAFTINGIANGRDGKMYIVYNDSGQAMTIADESGVEAVAANRLVTMTGADIVTSGDAAFTIVYDSGQSRWIVVNTED